MTVAAAAQSPQLVLVSAVLEQVSKTVAAELDGMGLVLGVKTKAYARPEAKNRIVRRSQRLVSLAVGSRPLVFLVLGCGMVSSAGFGDLGVFLGGCIVGTHDWRGCGGVVPLAGSRLVQDEGGRRMGLHLVVLGSCGVHIGDTHVGRTDEEVAFLVRRLVRDERCL